MKLSDFIHYIEPAGKFRTYWTAKVGQLTATGTTADEATKALTAKVEHAFTGSYAPVVIPHGNHVAYIWREPENGWCYCVRGKNFDGILDMNLCIAGDYAKTVRCARRHLADYVQDSMVFKHPEEAAECILDEADRRDFISQCYRTKRVQAIMIEHNLDWQTANEIEDGLRPHPALREACEGEDDMSKRVEDTRETEAYAESWLGVAPSQIPDAAREMYARLKKKHQSSS